MPNRNADFCSTIALGASSYAYLALASALIFKDGILQALSLMTSTTLLYVIPMAVLIASVSARICLAIRFGYLMGLDVTDGERTEDLSNTDTMVWIGISVSAFFALVAASFAAPNYDFDVQPVMFFIVIAFLGFHASQALKSYKHKWWQQQTGEILENAAMTSFLAAIIATLWQAKFGTSFLILITCFFVGGWLVDYVMRYKHWSNYFQASAQNYKGEAE